MSQRVVTTTQDSFGKNNKEKVMGVLKKVTSVPGKIVDSYVDKVKKVDDFKRERNVKIINKKFGSTENYKAFQQEEALKNSMKKK